MRRLTFTKMMAAVVAAAIIAAVASAASKHPAVSMTGRGPSFCRAADVHQIVRDFVTAFNRGDDLALSLMWVRIRYQWYAVNDFRNGRNVNHIEYTRRGALAYFADRHRHGERLELVDFAYGGFNAGWGHFDFRMRRQAPDVRGGQPTIYRGAGTVSCLQGPVGLGRWTMTMTA